jgi:hypothetical protein
MHTCLVVIRNNLYYNERLTSIAIRMPLGGVISSVFLN